MREIGLQELKEIQLDILRNVHMWCSENKIKYWLDCGTLLGAIRHKGYIPWDDDIDIGMLREDYDRFCKNFRSLDGKYKVICIENDKHFYQPHAKILDTSTFLIDGGYETCINIDLFVYDNAPDDDSLANKMFKRRAFLRKLLEIKQNISVSDENSIILKTKRLVEIAMLSLIPNRLIVKAMVRNCKKFSKTETKRIGNFSSYANVVCDKEIFNSFIDAEFEGEKYKIPSEYDKWLRAFYGDYMILPDEEKRVSHHLFKAYKTE